MGDFARLAASDGRLAARCLLLVLAVRAGLRLLPFARVERLLKGLCLRQKGSRACVPSPGRIGRVSAAAADCVPGASCLVRALTVRALLRRYGHKGVLRIGVARGEGPGIRAHAWVESEGRVLVGDLPDLGDYAPLAPPALRLAEAAGSLPQKRAGEPQR